MMALRIVDPEAAYRAVDWPVVVLLGAMMPVAGAIESTGLARVIATGLIDTVAIGASCAFLTPLGHQNNTLILGPGGLKFGDYWRLGLSLEIVVVLVAVPMLLWVWPL